MNGTGLAAVMQGFQQGYSFMDDMNRKKKQDEREDTRFDWEKKDRAKKDDYDAKSQAIQDKYFPRTAKTAIAPLAAGGLVPGADPAADADAAAGLMPAAPAAPVSEPVPAPAAAAGAQPASAAAPMAPAAAPTAPAAPSAAPVGPTATPAAAAPTPAAPTPAAANGTGKPDPTRDMNRMMDFTIERAMLDVQHGKLDGPGMLTLVKGVEAMKREKMDDAIKLMHQGRIEEAQDAFNSGGDHKMKIVDAKDDVFTVGKTQVPTKIITMQGEDGRTKTVNTAQMMYQQQAIDKIISQRQHDRQTDVQEQHGKDVVAATRDGHQLTYKAAMAGVGVQAANNKLQREKFDWEKTQTGALTADKMDKVGEKILRAATDVWAPKDGMTIEEKKALDVKRTQAAAAGVGVYQQAYALGVPVNEITAMRAVQLAEDPKNLVKMRHTDGNEYPGVKVNGRFVPVGGPLQASSAAPAAPGSTPAAPPMVKRSVAANGVAPAPAPSKAEQLGGDFASRQAKLLELSKAAESDADLQALAAQARQARSAGKAVQANDAITRYNALKKERYGL